jgi:hypothetical protein
MTFIAQRIATSPFKNKITYLWLNGASQLIEIRFAVFSIEWFEG